MRKKAKPANWSQNEREGGKEGRRKEGWGKGKGGRKKFEFELVERLGQNLKVNDMMTERNGLLQGRATHLSFDHHLMNRLLILLRI